MSDEQAAKPKRHAPRGRIKARYLMEPPKAKERCTAKSKQSGERCKRWPIPGGTVCVIHGGGIPLVRQKAQERLTEYQNRAIDRLFELAEQKEYPSTALSAVRDVLDRTMGKAIWGVESEMESSWNGSTSIWIDVSRVWRFNYHRSYRAGSDSLVGLGVTLTGTNQGSASMWSADGRQPYRYVRRE